jgi:hypothetical protein
MKVAVACVVLLASLSSPAAGALDEARPDRSWQMAGLFSRFGYDRAIYAGNDSLSSGFAMGAEVPLASHIKGLHGFGLGVTIIEMWISLADDSRTQGDSPVVLASWAPLYVYYPLVLSPRRHLSDQLRDIRPHSLMMYAGGSAWAWDKREYLHFGLRYLHTFGLVRAPTSGREVGVLGLSGGLVSASARGSGDGMFRFRDTGWYVGVVAGIGGVSR